MNLKIKKMMNESDIEDGFLQAVKRDAKLSNLAKTYFLYNTEEVMPLLDRLELSPLMKTSLPSQQQPSTSWAQPEGVNSIATAEGLAAVALEDLCVSNTLFCSYCKSGFLDKESQRAHYKLDWHRYNLKQILSSKKTISEERFAQIAGDDDMSSISGSESEDDLDNDGNELDGSVHDDERLKHLITRKSRVLFNNSKGQVISVHRCLLLNKKEEAASDEHLIDLVTKLPRKTSWFVVMIGGGHFAAALFRGSDPVLHKTFHSYTVRAKQGGSQSSKDNKGTHAKSAGASLRRYNEQVFTQHIQELMKSWGPDLVKCDLIFYKAVGRNSAILFSGSNAPFIKTDPRLRGLPFPSRRPTFNEVKRVHSLLSMAYVYDSNEVFKTIFSPPRPVKEENEGKRWTRKNSDSESNSLAGSPKKSHIDRGKERPSPVRELPDIVQHLAAISTSGSEGDMAILMEEGMEEVSFNSLKEFEDTVPQSVKDRVCAVRKKPKKKKAPKEPSSEESLRDEVKDFWKTVHGAVVTGENDRLKTTLEEAAQTLTPDEISCVLNQKNISGETVLHNMAAEGKLDTLWLLMLHGSDPNIKDKKSLTAYDHSLNKDTRNAFRRFMGEYPDRYDYSKSHIPGPLTEYLENEIQEKRKAAKKAKRVRDKEKKQEKEKEKAEEEEKQRYLNLSDREKRALAAERRILAQSDKNVVLIRCFNCAQDMTGKVPFEYDNNRFCSMDCLKAHRIKSKQL